MSLTGLKRGYVNFKTLVARPSRQIMDFDVSVGRNYRVPDANLALYIFVIKRRGVCAAFEHPFALLIARCKDLRQLYQSRTLHKSGWAENKKLLCGVRRVRGGFRPLIYFVTISGFYALCSHLAICELRAPHVHESAQCF
jgi:hypothetical protein